MTAALFFLASITLLVVVAYQRREIDRQSRLVHSLAERCHAQSQLLTQRAER